MQALHITEPLPSVTVLSLDWIGMEALTLRLLTASEPDEDQGSELEHWHGVNCRLLSHVTCPHGNKERYKCGPPALGSCSGHLHPTARASSCSFVPRH